MAISDKQWSQFNEVVCNADLEELQRFQERIIHEMVLEEKVRDLQGG